MPAPVASNAAWHALAQVFSLDMFQIYMNIYLSERVLMKPEFVCQV